MHGRSRVSSSESIFTVRTELPVFVLLVVVLVRIVNVLMRHSDQCEMISLGRKLRKSRKIDPSKSKYVRNGV